MITLIGGSGKGSLWGTFYAPDRENDSVPLYSLKNGHIDQATPPSEWYLPPPDKMWYPVDLSPYGPRLATLDIGSIKSVDDRSAEWNPCGHSTIRGNAYCLGLARALGPYFRYVYPVPTSGKDAYQAVSTGEHPAPLPFRLARMLGRPCIMSDTKVRDYRGAYVSLKLDAYADRYWATNTTLSMDFASDYYRSLLAQSGVLHEYGKWYMCGPDHNLVTDPSYMTYYYKTLWQRPDRTTFVREGFSEYHDPRSYTPAHSTAWTNIPFVVVANHRISTFKVTHVMSNSPGSFSVRYDQRTELGWFGYSGINPFHGSLDISTKGLEANILTLEPGLTTERIVDATEANRYCSLASERARMLYDHKSARSSRTKAVCDVQELDSNWLENLAQVKGTLDVVKPILEGYKAIETGNPEAARKALASGYLAYKYAVAPTISDANNLEKDGDRMFQLATTNRFSRERRRGATIVDGVPVCDSLATLSYFTTYHLQLKSDMFSQLWSGLERLGLDPSSGQAWDFIPFSFVVDWFKSVGNALTAIDAYNSLVLHRDVLARIETFKVMWPVRNETIYRLFGGDVYAGVEPLSYSWYDRRIYDHVGSIDPMSLSDNDGLTLSQMTQGTALLTQMR